MGNKNKNSGLQYRISFFDEQFLSNQKYISTKKEKTYPFDLCLCFINVKLDYNKEIRGRKKKKKETETKT